MQPSRQSHLLSSLPGWPYLQSDADRLLPLDPSPEPFPPTSFYPCPPPPAPHLRPASTQATFAHVFLHHPHQHSSLDSISDAAAITLLSAFPWSAFSAEEATLLVEEEADWVALFDLTRARGELSSDDEGEDDDHWGELEGREPMEGEEEEDASEARDADYSARSPRQTGAAREKPPRRGRTRRKGRGQATAPAVTVASSSVSAEVTVTSSASAVDSTVSVTIHVQMPAPGTASSSSSSCFTTAVALSASDGGQREGRRLLIEQDRQRCAESRGEEAAAMLDADHSKDEDDAFLLFPSNPPSPAPTRSSALSRDQHVAPRAQSRRALKMSGQREEEEQATGRQRRRVRHPHQRGDRVAALPFDRPIAAASSPPPRRASASRQRQRRSLSRSHQHSASDEGTAAPLTRSATKAARPPQPHSTLNSSDRPSTGAAEVEGSTLAAPRGSHPVRIVARKGGRYRVEWSQPEGAPDQTWERCSAFERWAEHAHIVDRWNREGGDAAPRSPPPR